MFLPNVLARFADRRLSTMSTSPSESNLPWLDESLSYSGAAGAGGRIVMAIATDRNAPFQDLYTVSGAAWYGRLYRAYRQSKMKIEKQ